jgi:hypothetical protein
LIEFVSISYFTIYALVIYPIKTEPQSLVAEKSKPDKPAPPVGRSEDSDPESENSQGGKP